MKTLKVSTVAELINPTLLEMWGWFMTGNPRLATCEESEAFQGCDGDVYVSDPGEVEFLGRKWEFQVMGDLNSRGMEIFVVYEDGSYRTWNNGNQEDVEGLGGGEFPVHRRK